MDAERLDRVSLLGHDWGGVHVVLRSLEHPERIERMIALDVTPPWRGRLQARHLAAPLMVSYQTLLATPILGPAAMTSGKDSYAASSGMGATRRCVGATTRSTYTPAVARAATCERELGLLPQLPHP